MPPSAHAWSRVRLCHRCAVPSGADSPAGRALLWVAGVLIEDHRLWVLSTVISAPAGR